MATACINSIWTPAHCEHAVRAGADQFRISTAYGAPSDHVRLLEDLRAAGVACDVSVKVGYDLNNGTKLRILGSDPVPVREGDTFFIESRPDPETLSFDRELTSPLPRGETLYFGDSDLMATVLRYGVDGLECSADTDGFVRPGKSVSSRNRDLGLGPINPLNEHNFLIAVEAAFDFVILSFVRSPDEVLQAREILSSLGDGSVRIVSKIETRQALDHVQAIAAESDAVMVARGDLAIQVGFERLAVAQWLIAGAAARQHIPFIVATQAFESALTRSRASAADIVNVAEAAAMGAAAIMLGPETCRNKAGPPLIRTVADIVAATTAAGVSVSVEQHRA